MIVSMMAGFAFGYCIMDMISNVIQKRQTQKLLKETIHD